jgi:ABC-type sugar transport system ATPase subunit
MIRLTNLHKKFESRGIAGINGVSLELKKGEILAVMGPNGSGKSSLIKLIMGLIEPDSGTVELDGQARIFSGAEETEDMNVQKYLINKNVYDIEEEKKLQLARDFADIFEFTFQLRQNLSQLSAGQKQKVSLAAELINRPALLLLDEPFTHLDPHTRNDILASLFQYIKNQEISLIWVTHERDEALRFSDRVGILNFGKFEQIDASMAMIERPQNLFVAQFLGFENFLPAKKTSDGWQTPWGAIPLSVGPESTDAILVVPPTSLELKQGAEAKVESHGSLGVERRLILRLNERVIQMNLPRNLPFPSINSNVFVAARLTECFLIPL